MSEESWRFFLDEWSRYQRQTDIKNQELLDELWNCMSDELRQLAFAEGGTANLTTEAEITKRMPVKFQEKFSENRAALIESHVDLWGGPGQLP